MGFGSLPIPRTTHARITVYTKMPSPGRPTRNGVLRLLHLHETQTSPTARQLFFSSLWVSFFLIPTPAVRRVAHWMHIKEVCIRAPGMALPCGLYTRRGFVAECLNISAILVLYCERENMSMCMYVGRLVDTAHAFQENSSQDVYDQQ